MPDRPVGDLRRTIDAFITRVAQVRRAAEAVVREGDDGIDGRRRSRLRRRILGLRETELAIDSQLGDSDDDASLRVHDLVLHVTLAAEALGERAVHGAARQTWSNSVTSWLRSSPNSARPDARPGPTTRAPSRDDDETPGRRGH